MFHILEEVESRCSFCPYRQTPQFIEVMYRWGHGTWEQLEDYCSRLKRFREATHGCSDWVKQRLAKLVGIPDHHVNVDYDGERRTNPQNSRAATAYFQFSGVYEADPVTFVSAESEELSGPNDT